MKTKTMALALLLMASAAGSAMAQEQREREGGGERSQGMGERGPRSSVPRDFGQRPERQVEARPQRDPGDGAGERRWAGGEGRGGGEGRRGGEDRRVDRPAVAPQSGETAVAQPGDRAGRGGDRTWQRGDRDGRSDGQRGDTGVRGDNGGRSGWTGDRGGEHRGDGQRGDNADRPGGDRGDWNRDGRGDRDRSGWNPDDRRDGRDRSGWNNNDRRGENDRRGDHNWNDRSGRNPPSNWRRWDRNRFPPVYQSRQRYRGGYWNAPSGFYIRLWSFGDFLPRGWYEPNYRIYDYWLYDLPMPPPGYDWVRVGEDAILVDRFTGRVVQVVRYVFW